MGERGALYLPRRAVPALVRVEDEESDAGSQSTNYDALMDNLEDPDANQMVPGGMFNAKEVTGLSKEAFKECMNSATLAYYKVVDQLFPRDALVSENAEGPIINAIDYREDIVEGARSRGHPNPEMVDPVSATRL
jgi:hypothetical protein